MAAMVDIKEIEAFFFKAMLQGYATGAKTYSVGGMPWHKKIELIDGELRLTDIYAITQLSLKSAGTTTIFWQNNPVWVMQYSGFYEKEAIPFLRKALTRAYTENLFMGGRGPWQFNQDEWLYFNKVTGDFTNFSGREHILRGNRNPMGHHEYSGFYHAA